jgi:pimeloyl-ACP methyl ester carboxylesterase
VLKALKQWIDRGAINMAAKSLAPGNADAARVLRAHEMLADPELLRPIEETARLTFGAKGEFQFTSTLPSGVARNDTVHGRLFLAGESWAAKPMVILVHGWNAELHYLYVLPFVARALNRRGLNAALLELPFHLHRRPTERNGMRDFISDDLPGMLMATRQALSDIHALARWAKAQGCPSVGVWGFSLGAWLTGLYVCQSDLAAAAVLTTPVSNLACAVRDLAFCHPIRSGLNGSELDLSALNLTQQRPRINPAAIQVVESSYDLFVPKESYRELAAAWGLKEWNTQRQGHISVLTSRKAMKQSIAWFVGKL